MPAFQLTPLARNLGIAVLAAGLFAAGWAVRGWKQGADTASAVIKRDAQVDKIEAGDKADVKEQDDGDAKKITQIEADLIAARRELAASLRRGSGRPVPRPQADAGAGSRACPEPEPDRGRETADRAMEERELAAGAVAERMRLQVLSCRAQWPR